MKYLLTTLLAAPLVLFAGIAQASVGLTELPGSEGDGPVTVFYPSSSAATRLTRGPFTLDMAWNGNAIRGNGRLIVLSHGSGGSPWPQSDLARSEERRVGKECA